MATNRADRVDGAGETPPTQDPSCTICLGVLTCPVCTNCGHKFCARCILTHWRHDRWPNACRCPVCRRDVTLLMGGDEWNSVENRAAFNEVADYNHRVSTTNSPDIFSRLQDIPAVYRELYHGMFRMGGFPVCSRLYVMLVLLLALLYLVSPIDILPEGLLGVFGLADDLLAVVMALLFGMNLYRDYLVHAGEQQR